MSKLLALDLDGTLFYPKQITRLISKKNVRFLRRWIDAGNKVVLISSRSVEFIANLKKEIKRDFDFIASSSSQISANGVLIKDDKLNNEELYKVLATIEEEYKPIAYLASGKKSGHIIKGCSDISRALLFFYTIWRLFQFKYREPFVIDNIKFDDFIKNGEVSKIMIFYGLSKKKILKAKEINKLLRDQYNDIESSWTSQVNELTPLGCSKSEGLKLYCEKMNIDKSDVYVVGDSGNDISMFNDFHEHSYCMKHSYPAVKKYAANVISRVYKLDKIVLKGEIKNETN